MVETVQRKRRFGLKPQLVLLLLSLNLISAFAYTTALYTNSKSEIIAGIDGRLAAAVNAGREIIPEGYHRRVEGADSIPQDEFDEVQKRLSRFANDSGFVYVYSYMKFGDEIRTVATSATSSELKDGAQTGYFALYNAAPVELFRSFADGRVRFDEYHDSFGSFRSIYKPIRSEDGRIHVIGADIDLASLDKRLHQALVKSILIGIMMFALAMAVGLLLIARIVGPLVRLTAYTRNMEQRSFEPDEEEMAAMHKISQSRGDEVGSLAEAMAAMMAREGARLALTDIDGGHDFTSATLSD